MAAALRETIEELGLDLQPADLEFGHIVHSQETPQREWIHVFFLCRRWSGNPVNREPHKHSEIRWWPAHQPPQDTVDYCAQALRHLLVGEAFSQHHTATTYPARSTPTSQEAVLGDAGLPGSLHRVLSDIADERLRQQTVYGVQQMPSGNGPRHREAATTAQTRVDTAGAQLTWVDLALEEVREACTAENDEDLYSELIQASAVLVQWAQSLKASAESTNS
ncbi:hypothetical protein BJF83_23245 [Nocardiopsis sp. CNR-923]|nr:hypothetical protein BJF83_23245 [Nocardiopsis sp. CNR-923]